MPQTGESPDALPYLRAYSPETISQVKALLDGGDTGAWFSDKYPHPHAVKSDTALYAYVQSIRQNSIRSGASLSKVAYDNKLHVIHHALGTHTRIARVQGGKLKTKHELRIASLFKFVPQDFLRMIVVHELAHLRESEHNKAFYQLCLHLEPRYHPLEFELRVYLTHLERGGAALWMA